MHCRLKLILSIFSLSLFFFLKKLIKHSLPYSYHWKHTDVKSNRGRKNIKDLIKIIDLKMKASALVVLFFPFIFCHYIFIILLPHSSEWICQISGLNSSWVISSTCRREPCTCNACIHRISLYNQSRPCTQYYPAWPHFVISLASILCPKPVHCINTHTRKFSNSNLKSSFEVRTIEVYNVMYKLLDLTSLQIL